MDSLNREETDSAYTRKRVPRLLEIIANYERLCARMQEQSQLNRDIGILIINHLTKKTTYVKKFREECSRIILRMKENELAINNYNHLLTKLCNHKSLRNRLQSHIDKIIIGDTFASKKKRTQDRIVADKYRIKDFRLLTRLLFDDVLPKKCEHCGTDKRLEIHHIRYEYPIKSEDLIRLCRVCHAKLEGELRRQRNHG